MLAHLLQFCKRVSLFALPVGRGEQDTPAPTQISYAQATRRRMSWYRPQPWRFDRCGCTFCVGLPRSAVRLPGLLVVFPSLLCIAPRIPDLFSLTSSTRMGPQVHHSQCLQRLPETAYA